MNYKLVAKLMCIFGILLGAGLFLFVPMVGFSSMVFPNETYEILQILSILLPIMVIVLINKNISKHISIIWFIIISIQTIQLINPILAHTPHSLSSPTMSLFVINILQSIVSLIAVITIFIFSKKSLQETNSLQK